MGKKKHSIDVLFIFVLFAVFAILSVMIIYIGSGVYEKISYNKSVNETNRTTLSYIANKIKASDKGDNVYLKESQGTTILVIRSGEEDDAIETLIYEYDGKLMEMTVFAGDMFDLSFGDRLLDTNGVDFVIDDTTNILKVLLTDANNRENTISVYLGTESGVR